MTQSTLTEAEAKKLKGVVSRVQGLPKADKAKQLTERFADKYLRFKLGRRGTGPHSHGLNETQRENLKSAIDKAFGITRKAPVRASGKKGGKATGKATGKRGGKSAAQLAKQQTARALGGAVAGQD